MNAMVVHSHYGDDGIVVGVVEDEETKAVTDC